MIVTKLVSSLEKAFLDDSIGSFAPLTKISALRGERLSMQLLYTYELTEGEAYQYRPIHVPISLEGTLAAYAEMRQVASVAVNMALCPGAQIDDNYLRTTPGLYPDLLAPLYYNGCAVALCGTLSSAWIELDLPETAEAGLHRLICRVGDETSGISESEIEIEIIDAVLPREEIYFTQWFHADCLANYYNVEVWSGRHWEIVENFVRTARRGGINLLLTPVFTPPLDTAIGGERRTVQLVGVTKSGEDYAFDFTLLDRWIEMCNRCEIGYFEISHLFTQWGAKHAPKIMATVDGEYRKLFGWETDATGEEYRTFLRTFLGAFLAHMKARGDDRRCFFHISDEPKMEMLEDYRAAKEIVADLLEDYPIIDALSDYDFYKRGVLAKPIPCTDHITPFLENAVPNLWTYYCVSQSYLVSNRFLAMPAWRTRSIGMQMYKYHIEGFLQWGYNFYNNRLSGDPINPYLDSSAALSFPAGDAYSVYPATDGTALESTRFLVFYEALQDIRAMKLCEQYYGHDAVVSAIEEELGASVEFDRCTHTADEMLRIRARINEMIRSAL